MAPQNLVYDRSSRTYREFVIARVVVPHCGQRRRKVISPLACNLRRCTQLAPELAEILEVGHVVFLEGLVQAVQSLLTHGAWHVYLGDDGQERFDGAIHGRTYAVRSTVDLLDGRRQLFQE